mmetsp:Transcript_17873/g.41030  ORF Transcript_17873/g.41030 Transcript_17873/m.41030 type:complete len:250 (-) Transcript_17873:375-1124(-)
MGPVHELLGPDGRRRQEQGGDVQELLQGGRGARAGGLPFPGGGVQDGKARPRPRGDLPVDEGVGPRLPARQLRHEGGHARHAAHDQRGQRVPQASGRDALGPAPSVRGHLPHADPQGVRRRDRLGRLRLRLAVRGGRRRRVLVRRRRRLGGVHRRDGDVPRVRAQRRPRRGQGGGRVRRRPGDTRGVRRAAGRRPPPTRGAARGPAGGDDVEPRRPRDDDEGDRREGREGEGGARLEAREAARGEDEGA